MLHENSDIKELISHVGTEADNKDLHPNTLRLALLGLREQTDNANPKSMNTIADDFGVISTAEEQNTIDNTMGEKMAWIEQANIHLPQHLRINPELYMAALWWDAKAYYAVQKNITQNISFVCQEGMPGLYRSVPLFQTYPSSDIIAHQEALIDMRNALTLIA